MNKTFKTIWNAVRGAYVTVNEAVCGASQKSGSVKLAVLTVAAAAALSAGDVVQASPDYVTSKVGDFNLSKQDEGDALDLIASKILLDEQSGATDGTVQFTFAGANVAAIQAVNGFSGFDKTNVGSISDIFSGAAGIHVRSTKADNNSFTLNNVNVTVGMQAGVSESELFGVWHDSGIVTVSDAATISVSNDATDIAMGYAFDSIHDNERPTPSSRQTTFTDTASISASSSVDGAWAAGIYMRANALDKPSLTFKKDAEISAHAASGEAGGIILNYSDYDSNNSTDGAQGGSVVFEDTSALTVEASGKAAVGVLVDVGSLIVNGKADIKASGTKNEYGIVIRGHGKATFNGETEVKAKNALVLTPEDELDGLNWANNEIYNFGYQTPRQPVAEFKGTTTLNGKVSLGDNTTLKIGGDVTVNGDYVSNGVTSGDGSLTIVNGQKTVFTQASNAVSAQTSTSKDINVSLQLGKLTISGGEVTNNANMLISDTLAITGNAVFINGSASDGTDDIWVKKITLDEGSTLRQTGGMHFQEGVVGGTWAEESKEFYDLDGNIAGDNTTELLLKLGLEDTDAPAEQKLALAGGHFTTVGSNEKAQVKEVELLKNYSVAYTKGTYDYSKFTVNTDGNRTDGAKNLRIAGASVTTDTLTLTAGSAAVESGSLSAAKLISNGKFEMSVDDAGTLAVKSFQGQQNGDFTLIAGKMAVEALDLTSGKLTIDGTATLATSSGQIFKTGLDAEGKEESAGSKNWENLVFTGGSLTLTDEKYNANYADSVKNILGSDTQVTYLGELVGGLTLDQAASIGGVHANTEIDATKNVDKDGTVSVQADVGGKTIDVGSASKVEVTSNTTLTLVGSSGDELINFSSTGDKAVDIQGTLKLGSVSVETSGKLTSTVNVEGTVAVENGSFDLTKLTTGATSSTTAAIEVNKGSLNVGTLELNNGKATISVSDDAKMKVDELAAKAGEHIITGAVEVGKLAQDAANALIQIGTTGESGLKGALTIAEGGLKGLKFFLDPTWKDGMEVTDASSLRIAETNVDGQIVVGQNSYVSLGTTDDSAFVQLFKDGTLTWGGENGTLAAVYVAKPITIASTGSLVVDASLKTVPANDPAAGSVTFAAGSVLVANVKNFKDGDTAITVDNGASITVAESSKAVVIAEAGQTFQLTSDDEVNKNYWNKAGDTLISANKLVSFNVGTDGKISTEAEDAEDVFAGLMQGAALANAGAASDNEAVKSYAEALLTDTTGKKSNAQIAREFDAAMNPAGTLGVFTTAKDRSTELRDAVRAHAGNGTANGLWVQVTGGKTKLKGISTGAQDLDLDTDAYGLAVGGEAAVQNITLGAAFMGGSGKTENDSVAGKDDFNYYGFPLYAKTQVQGIDLEGDLSAAWLKSDLTVGGAADVDTDTTTAVYSLGIQAKKTFNLGVDVTPFIGMDVYHIKSDGFTTNHGVSIEDANATIVEFPIGAEVKKAFQTASGFSVAPSFSLAVVPTVGSKDIDSKVRFAGAESTYNYTFADDVKVRSQLGIEAQKDNFTLGLAAGYDWGNEERSAVSVQLHAKYAF